MPSNGKWSVRLLRGGEATALHRLSLDCFGESSHSEWFIERRYCTDANPGADVLVADCDGKLIGAQAITYLKFLVGGREETVGMFTDGMTHPDHRRRGVFGSLLVAAERQAFDNGASLLFTMPNDRSLPSFAKSPGWHILPDRVLLARVLDMTGFLEDRGMPGLLARGTGALASWSLRHDSRDPMVGLIEVNDLASFAAEIDALAEKTLPGMTGIACARRHAFLDWRFAKNPSWRYRYFVAVDPVGRLAAYLVTVGERRMGTEISYAADMLWANEQSMGRLLDFAAASLKKSGARLFGSIVSSSLQVHMLRKAGFRRVPPAISKRSFHTAYAVHPDRSDVATVAREGDAWFLSLADFDTI